MSNWVVDHSRGGGGNFGGGTSRDENYYPKPLHYQSYHSISVVPFDENDERYSSITKQQRDARQTKVILAVLMVALVACLMGFSGGYYYALHNKNNSKDEEPILAVIHPLPWQEREFADSKWLSEYRAPTGGEATSVPPPNSIVGLPMPPPSKLALLGNPKASSELIYFHHTEAYDLLLEDGVHASLSSSSFQKREVPQISRYSHDFFLITSGWDVQINQVYCGVASTAAVLNSLRFFHSSAIDIPSDALYDPYAYVTQHDVFNACTQESVIWHNDEWDGLRHSPGGLGLDQVARLLQCHLRSPKWKVTAHHLDSSTKSVEEVRDELKEALQNDKTRVLVNYHRATAGQMGGGHWSPLGSYSVSTDRFLIMDVAKYKYPPVWMPTTTLYQSMATTDGCGTWNYPEGQAPLRKDKALLSAPDNELAKILKCAPALRGYVIVEQQE